MRLVRSGTQATHQTSAAIVRAVPALAARLGSTDHRTQP